MSLKNQSSPLPGKGLETRAVYVESRIKTYGFQRITDVALFEVSADPAGMAPLGRALVQLGEQGASFQLLFCRTSSRKHEITLLVSREWEKAVLGSMDRLARETASFRLISPVEIVFFHGPHFGDRFGILETACRALAERGVPMLATACSGSSIFLVLPVDKSGEAVGALSEAFEVPGMKPSHRGRQAGR